MKQQLAKWCRTVNSRMYAAALPVLPVLLRSSSSGIDWGRASKRGIICAIIAVAVQLVVDSGKKKKNQDDNDDE